MPANFRSSEKHNLLQGIPEQFALYTESIMNNTSHMKDITSEGYNISNLRCKDYTAITAESENQPQRIVDIVTEKGRKAGLAINLKKSYTQVISKKTTSTNAQFK